MTLSGPTEPRLLAEYECGDCERTFTRKDTLLRHIRSTHGPTKSTEPTPKGDASRCPICGLKFSRADAARRHLLNTHDPSLSLSAGPEGPTLLTCPTCHRVGFGGDFHRNTLGDAVSCNPCWEKRQRRDYESPSRWRVREAQWRAKGMVRPDGRPFLQADFERLLEVQNGNCAVCRERLPIETGKGFVLDHHHADGDAGPVRGVVHQNCNLSIIGTNTLSSLPSLTHYLTDPPAQRALSRGKERLEPEHLLPTRCYRKVRK